jgi:hypothetical protein
MMQDIDLYLSFYQMLCSTLAPEPFRDPLLTPRVIAGDRSDANVNMEPSFACERYLSACFAFSLAWGLGGHASSKTRGRLSTWCRSNIPELHLVDQKADRKASTPRAGKKMQAKQDAGDDDGDIFACMISWHSPHGYLCPWSTQLPQTIQSKEPAAHLVVPTAVTACYSWLAFVRARQQCNSLLIGPTGTSKTLVGMVALRRPQQVQPWTFMDIALTRSTSVEHIRNLFYQLHSKKIGVIGAPAGTLAIAFVDDVALPMQDAVC